METTGVKTVAAKKKKRKEKCLLIHCYITRSYLRVLSSPRRAFMKVFSSERSNKMLNVLTRTTNTYTTSIMKKDQEIEKLREYSNFLKMKNDEYKSQLTSMTNEKTPTVAGDYSAH